MIYEDLIAFDHLQNQIILFSNVQIDDSMDLRIAYDRAMNKIDEMGEDLHTDIDYQSPNILQESTLHSNFTKVSFMNAVEKVKEHIKAGDIFQLVLNRFYHRAS